MITLVASAILALHLQDQTKEFKGIQYVLPSGWKQRTQESWLRVEPKTKIDGMEVYVIILSPMSVEGGTPKSRLMAVFEELKKNTKREFKSVSKISTSKFGNLDAYLISATYERNDKTVLTFFQMLTNKKTDFFASMSYYGPVMPDKIKRDSATILTSIKPAK